MFLKRNRRKNSGREFTCYNIVENRRCPGGKVVQRQVLYPGELNASQLCAWRKTIEVFDQDAASTAPLALFELGRLPEVPDDTHVEIRLRDLQLRRPPTGGAAGSPSTTGASWGSTLSSGRASAPAARSPAGSPS